MYVTEAASDLGTHVHADVPPEDTREHEGTTEADARVQPGSPSRNTSGAGTVRGVPLSGWLSSHDDVGSPGPRAIAFIFRVCTASIRARAVAVSGHSMSNAALRAAPMSTAIDRR
jgi:hypothetical protein